MRPTAYIDWDRLASELRADRKNSERSIRDTARLAGMYLGPYQRAEAGTPLDADNFMRACAWLDADPRDYLRGEK